MLRGWYPPIVFCLALPLMAQDGTASLSGQVRDIAGIVIPGVGAELRSTAGRFFKSTSDPAGKYAFSNLPADEYILKLEFAGFKSVTVQSIQLAEGERTAIPLLRLVVSMDCGEYAAPDYLRLLPLGEHGAGFRGTVKVDRGSDKPYGRPVKDAQVTLLCPGGATCGTAKTDVNGEFLFRHLPMGIYSLRVQHSGFYPHQSSGFDLQEGFEWHSWPLSLERCPLGDCDPRKRPKRPPMICE